MTMCRKLGPLARMAPAFLLALALAACATTRTTPALDQARASYSSAAQDPTVVSNAPDELQRAKTLLDRANAAATDNDDQAEISHRAYLASQQVAIAREVAKLDETKAQIKATTAKRQETVLSARASEAETAQARAQRLQQELAALQAKQTSEGMVMTLNNVLFRTDQAELAPGAQATIDRLATFLSDNPKQTIRIEGYTDSTGSEPYNLALSQQRADAVKAALVAHGIDPSRIQTQGLGETSPVASNATIEGRQMNRRVEVVVPNVAANQQPNVGGVEQVMPSAGGTTSGQ